MSRLTNQDLIDLVAWRHKLHRMPELSNEEQATAREVESFLADTSPDRVIAGLGGHGLAFLYEGRAPGPTLLFRAELDALPIEEVGDVPYRSEVPGKGHLCGHDGHMAMLAGLGRVISRRAAGDGARRADVPAGGGNRRRRGGRQSPIRAMREFAPDYAFSLHNLPGIPLGHVSLKEGLVNCASRGMRIVLEGKTAHASMPETGISPMMALARLMPALTALSSGGVLSEDFSLVTVTHANMGEQAHGIAPGRAELWASLRTLKDTRMDELVGKGRGAGDETRRDADGLKATDRLCRDLPPLRQRRGGDGAPARRARRGSGPAQRGSAADARIGGFRPLRRHGEDRPCSSSAPAATTRSSTTPTTIFPTT